MADAAKRKIAVKFDSVIVAAVLGDRTSTTMTGFGISERAEIGGGRADNQRVRLERGARGELEPSSHRGKRGTAGPRVERLP